MTEDNVTYADIIDVNLAIQNIDKKLALEGNSQEEINYLNSEKSRAQAFKELIENNKAKLDSIMTSYRKITVDDLKLTDYDGLNEVILDAKALLVSNNLTERQRRDLETKSAQLNVLFNYINAVKIAQDAIIALPDAEVVDNTHVVLVCAAKNAYKVLSVNQRSLLCSEDIAKYEAVITAYDSKYPTPIIPTNPTTPTPEVKPEVPSIDITEAAGKGVEIESAEGKTFDPDTKFIVNKKDIQKLNKLAKLPEGLKLVEAYDISLMLNDVKIQPDGKVNVRLKLSDELKDKKDLAVIFIDDNGKITEMDSIVSDGYICFITDHFSTYVIIEKTLSTTPETTNPKTGDSNNVVFVLIFTVVAFGALTVRKKIFN